MADRSEVDRLVNEQIAAVQGDYGDGWTIKNVGCLMEIETSDGEMDFRFRHTGGVVTGVGMLKLAEKLVMADAETEQTQISTEAPREIEA